MVILPKFQTLYTCTRSPAHLLWISDYNIPQLTRRFQRILDVHLQSAFLSMCSYPFALVSIGVSCSFMLAYNARLISEVQPSGEDLGESVSRSQMLCYTPCRSFLSYIYEYYFYRNAGKISLKSLNTIS